MREARIAPARCYRACPKCRPREEAWLGLRLVLRGLVGLHQLQQHPSRAGWMYEDVSMSAGTNLDFIRDQPHAIILQLFDCSREIRHTQGNVVKSLASPGNKFRDKGALR